MYFEFKCIKCGKINEYKDKDKAHKCTKCKGKMRRVYQIAGLHGLPTTR